MLGLHWKIRKRVTSLKGDRLVSRFSDDAQRECEKYPANAEKGVTVLGDTKEKPDTLSLTVVQGQQV